MRRRPKLPLQLTRSSDRGYDAVPMLKSPRKKSRKWKGGKKEVLDMHWVTNTSLPKKATIKEATLRVKEAVIMTQIKCTVHLTGRMSSRWRSYSPMKRLRPMNRSHIDTMLAQEADQNTPRKLLSRSRTKNSRDRGNSRRLKKKEIWMKKFLHIRKKTP